MTYHTPFGIWNFPFWNFALVFWNLEFVYLGFSFGYEKSFIINHSGFGDGNLCMRTIKRFNNPEGGDDRYTE